MLSISIVPISMVLCVMDAIYSFYFYTKLENIYFMDIYKKRQIDFIYL